MPSSQSKLLHYIDENLSKGILFLADYWNQLEDESFSAVIDQMYWMDHPDNGGDNDDCPPLQHLVIKGHVAGHVLTQIVTFFNKVQPSIRVLEMTDPRSPFWLLPGLLRMLPTLQTLVLRNPVVVDDDDTGDNDGSSDTAELWRQIHTVLPTMKHLRCLSVTWNNTETAAYATRNDDPPKTFDLVQALHRMPSLTEYRQEGQSPLLSHQWTTTTVLHVFSHSTLECFRLACPILPDQGMSHDDLQRPPLPITRSTVLHIQLPHLSDPATRDWLLPHVPHYAVLSTEDAGRLSPPLPNEDYAITVATASSSTTMDSAFSAQDDSVWEEDVDNEEDAMHLS